MRKSRQVLKKDFAGHLKERSKATMQGERLRLITDGGHGVGLLWRGIGRVAGW